MWLKLTFFIGLICFGHLLFGQTTERNTYAVFTTITPNDSLLLAGGQIMSGDSETNYVEHGYYPLNQSLLSTHKTEYLTTFVAYPNPFLETFTLQWSNYSGEVITLNIYGINGELIKTRTVIGQSVVINLADYSNGVYYVTAFSNGALLFNQKLIKS